jgi:hypothetical protein
MILPHADRALIDIAKLRDYSLNPEHEEGKHKARVFRSALGLTASDADKLRQIILDKFLIAEATQHSSTDYGERFVVDFEIEGLQGSVMIRTAWIIRDSEDFPRLTSCYIL